MDIVDSHAEGGVIATLISHPEFMHNISYLKDTHFYDPFNRAMHWAIRTLVESGVENIDAVNIFNQVNSNPGVQNIVEDYGFDIKKMSEYVDASKIASRDTVEEYKLLVDTVVSLSFKRDLKTFSEHVGRACEDKELELSQLNDFVNTGLTKITDRYIFGADSVLFGEKVADKGASIGIYKPSAAVKIIALIGIIRPVYLEMIENSLAKTWNEHRPNVAPTVAVGV